MHKTPLLDQLESGPYPSFVKDLKRLAATKPQVNDLLGQLERSYKEKITHWKHGGIVGVLGYGSGIIGRYSDLPDEFPGLEPAREFILQARRKVANEDFLARAPAAVVQKEQAKLKTLTDKLAKLQTHRDRISELMG